MKKIEQAFRDVPRAAFLPDSQARQVGIDAPLPIGFGQTNSQPSTVKMMLEWLEVEPGNKILDVGSGSGWTTALLAHLTGARGQVLAVEIVPQLLEFGRRNCQRLKLANVQFFPAEKGYGLATDSPYDRILVSASAHEVPQELLEQLKLGGKLVIPVDNDILEIAKTTNGKVKTKVHPGFVFVQLIKPS